MCSSSSKRTLAEAGLPRLRFHDLRHLTGTLLGALGVPLRTTMAILGHSQVATTVEVYQHVTDDQSGEALDRLGRLLESSGG